jgi:hypothetical protein
VERSGRGIFEVLYRYMHVWTEENYEEPQHNQYPGRDLNRTKPEYEVGVITTVHLSMALQSFVGPCRFFSFLNLNTVGRTPWAGDQPVARPLPTHRTTQTHDPSFRASEDGSCIRPLGHCGRPGVLTTRRRVEVCTLL